MRRPARLVDEDVGRRETTGRRRLSACHRRTAYSRRLDRRGRRAPRSCGRALVGSCRRAASKPRRAAEPSESGLRPDRTSSPGSPQEARASLRMEKGKMGKGALQTSVQPALHHSHAPLVPLSGVLVGVRRNRGEIAERKFFKAHVRSIQPRLRRIQGYARQWHLGTGLTLARSAISV